MKNDAYDSDAAVAEAAMAQKGFGYSRPRGRPTLPKHIRKNTTSVTMTVNDAMFFQRLGGGNISEGVRRAARILQEQNADALHAIRRAAEARDQTALPKPGQEDISPEDAARAYGPHDPRAQSAFDD